MKKEEDLEWALKELHDSVSLTSQTLVLLVVTLVCALFIMYIDLGEEIARKSVMWLLGAAAAGVLPCFISLVVLAKRIWAVRRSIAENAFKESTCSGNEDE